MFFLFRAKGIWKSMHTPTINIEIAFAFEKWWIKHDCSIDKHCLPGKVPNFSGYLIY